MPISFRVRASLVKAPLLSASTNDRSGFRVDRVICLSAHVPARPRHRLRLARVIPSLRKLPALHSWLPRQSHYLWLLPFRFAPTPLLRRGVGTLHYAVNPATSACFSDSQGQAYALRPPVGALPPSATILPPGRGLMNARRLARGTRSLFAEGRYVGGFDYRPHPERGFCNGI